MKSILVLDTPKNCGECHMYYNAGFYCEPEHCPLSPLPQKEENHYTEEISITPEMMKSKLMDILKNLPEEIWGVKQNCY